MRRSTLVLAALALTGCGNLLGIEVLSYDGGANDGSNTPDSTGNETSTSPDGGTDGAKDGTTGDGKAGDGPIGSETSSDVTLGGDTLLEVGTETGPETGAPESGLPEGGCTAGSSGCTGNAPWTCVNGTPTVGATCVDMTCIGGSCQGVCAPGQTQCNATSTEFQTCQTDGTWGNTATCTGPINGSPTCDPATGCGAGTCSNAALPTNCSGTCVNTASDGYNCGVCGQTCTGTTCSSGYCAVQAMCDGTGDGAVVNGGNAARLGFQEGLIPPLQKVLYGYFGAGGSVFGCPLPATATSPTPAPGVTIAGSGVICRNYYDDAVSDKSQAYVFDSLSGDCHGAALTLVSSDTNVGGAAFGTLLGDVSASPGLYSLVTASSALEIISFTTDSEAGTTTSASTPCVTVSGTLGDGAAGGSHAVAVDTAGGVIRGAAVTGGVCGTANSIATGMTSENAIAVSYDGSTVAFENGSNLYVCPTSGCSGANLTNPYATGLGTIARNGLVFDTSTPGNLYWVGSSGLQRCSAVAAGGTCTPTLLAPGVAATSGIGLDATYVYYLQGMVLDRVPR